MTSSAAIHRIEYGGDPSQFVELSLPDGSGPIPVIVVVHGGFWRQQYTVELARPLASDLAQHGVAALAIEYRRVGAGGTGGWPQTLCDVSAALDTLAGPGQLAARGRLDLASVAAVGHSAGGQLAAYLAHRQSLPDSAPGSLARSSGPVLLRGAVILAGVLDLHAAGIDFLGHGAVHDFLGGTPDDQPERYEIASPIGYVGDGAQIICVHGTVDDSVPLEQSRRYVAAAHAAGDGASLRVLHGVGHMELIDPRHSAWAVCRDAAVTLATGR